MSATGMLEAAQGIIIPETDDVTLSLAGDQEAFQRIYIQYAGLVSSVIHRCHLDSQREDLMQVTFTKVFQHLGDIRDVTTLKSWIGSIARTTCLNSHRSENRRRDTVSVDGITQDGYASELLQDSSTVDAPLNALILEEDIRSVRQAVASLQEPFKTLVDLYYFQALTEKEISVKMERPVGSVKSGLYRARAQLRSALEHTQVSFPQSAA